MENKIKIAIDAMSGEGSPKKIIEGINISLKSNKENFFLLYGKKKMLENEVSNFKIVNEHSKIIDTSDIILENESPFTAAKKGKESSMWKAIESQKENIFWWNVFCK